MQTPVDRWTAPHVDAAADKLRDALRMKAEQEDCESADEPSGVIGWVVAGLFVFVMGFAIAAQILWEVAQATL